MSIIITPYEQYQLLHIAEARAQFPIEIVADVLLRSDYAIRKYGQGGVLFVSYEELIELRAEVNRILGTDE